MRRTLALLVAPLLMLGGCKSTQSLGDSMVSVVGLGDDLPQTSDTTEVSVANRSGVAVADEPLAARAGAAVLANGGNAVDAATTVFFTLTATYPVAAGLGGGGICLLRDGGVVTEYDFLPRAAAGGGAYAVPGAARGFYDMQRTHGALPWQRTVAPGEAYAAAGFPISQALAVRLADAQAVIRLDAALAGEFLDESGQPKGVGTVVSNTALAQTLGSVRIEGSDGFFKGQTAARIAAYSAAQGGAITADELAATQASQTSARARTIGNMTVFLPGPRTGAGAFSGAMLDKLAAGQGIVEAERQTLAGFGVSALPRDLGSTGFAAVDANGQAVSCAVTLNGPFGSGHTAADTGTVLAASPNGPAGLASAFLTPVIAVDGSGVAVAGAGAGGPNGTALAANALLDAAGGLRPGRRSTGTAPFDTVNIVSCENGICSALSDPGGHGMGASADSVASQ